MLADFVPLATSTTGIFSLGVADSGLSADNASVLIAVPAMPTSFAPMVVTRLPANNFNAVTSVCTHRGCIVMKFNGTSIECPCHQSRFNPDGSVMNGPATSPLKKYVTTFDGADTLKIEIPNLGYEITSIQTATGPDARFGITFASLKTLKYGLHFRSAMNDPYQLIPFATTPTGAIRATSVKGTGTPLTIYVDSTPGTGFFALTRTRL